MRRRFDAAADGFDHADFVHARTREDLFARLEPIVVDAKLVLDLGSATGAAIAPLRKRFSRARVIAVDLSANMLARCRSRGSWLRSTPAVQADAAALPFADRSIDVVFSNLLLPWAPDPRPLVAEAGRVLRKDGLFVFSTLGPDSLLELRRAWSSVDDDEHVHRFLDMHDVGDALVSAGLRDPVLDVERLSVTWRDTASLYRDITAVGARNSLAGRARGLTGRARFEAASAALEAGKVDGEIRLGLELVYGHCWGSGSSPASDGVRIDPAAIRVRRG